MAVRECERSAVDWVARVLKHFRARKYLVEVLWQVPMGRRPDWALEAERVVKDWCVSAGWPLVGVAPKVYLHKRQWQLSLDLPCHTWLTPEGHKLVMKYLGDVFQNNKPWRKWSDVGDGRRMLVTGPYTSTRNSDPYPYSYRQCCRPRDIHAAATGLFELARRHLTPSLVTDPCW
jgi:hypothetical protein